MSDGFFFIGIIVLIFIVWVAEGGPAHPLSFSGPFITPIVQGVGTSSPGYTLSNGGTSSSQNNSSGAQQNMTELEDSLTSAARFGTPSVYKGLVTIRHSIGGLSTDDPDNEYVSISVSTRATSAGIDISGWRIEGEAEGRSVAIPEGVNLPRSGSVNQTAPIVLAPGQSAIITTGDSPLGASFRENMCTGYFDQFQEFTPYMTNYCPAPSSDFDRFYYGDPKKLDACKAYVQTVPRCSVPLSSPDNVGSDCERFVDDYLNYNGCSAAHEGEANFYGSEWRIYLSQTRDLFTHDHDTIKLLDTAGNTVDLLSY